MFELLLETHQANKLAGFFKQHSLTALDATSPIAKVKSVVMQFPQGVTLCWRCAISPDHEPKGNPMERTPGVSPGLPTVHYKPRIRIGQPSQWQSFWPHRRWSCHLHPDLLERIPNKTFQMIPVEGLAMRKGQQATKGLSPNGLYKKLSKKSYNKTYQWPITVIKPIIVRLPPPKEHPNNYI